MSTCVLDHLIHLTPPGSVEEISAEYRKLGFDVIPGGTHADGLTYNALVTLADGVYLELIAFVKPDPPRTHRWATATPGWIDFSNLALVSDIDRVINERAARDGNGAAYRVGTDGGRKTPAGETLEWRVTFPETKHGIGRLPFYCQDVTPREWRVPKPGNHPSTARGISHVKLLAVDTAELAALSAQLMTVFGEQPAETTPVFSRWRLDTPSRIPGLQPQLILELANSEELRIDKKSGIYEVGFWVEKGPGGYADTPYGKVVWTPIP